MRCQKLEVADVAAPQMQGLLGSDNDALNAESFFLD